MDCSECNRQAHNTARAMPRARSAAKVIAKSVLSFVVTISIAGALFAAPTESSVIAAAKAIKQLSKSSPEHDGVPLRRYRIEDIDGDGQAEVIEVVSAFESAPGFLNVELTPAFDWFKIYKLEKSGFREATKSFPHFLAERKEFHEHWLRLVLEPSALSEDSKALVGANRTSFEKTLRDYIGRCQ
jgi:hypothetical protein